MLNPNAPLSDSDARHLLRRTSLGGASKEREVRALIGVTRDEAAVKLLSFIPDNFTPQGENLDQVREVWVRRMIKTKKQLQERLVLFWHDHFATSDVIVLDHKQMGDQNGLLRRHCKGSYNRDKTRGSLKDFVKAINQDAAMMDMLDTKRNGSVTPNENYARELMELFTLGVFDSNGQENYTQEDVAQIARAFTGWRVDEFDHAHLEGGSGDTQGGTECDFNHAGIHDYTSCFPGRGPKTIFKSTGGFGPAGRSYAANGEGAPEIDTIIDIIFEHRDSDGHNTVARYVGRRLFEHFAYPSPPVVVVDEIIAGSSFDETFSVEAFLRALFAHDEFYATASPASAALYKSVRWPIDFAIGTLRRLRMNPSKRRFEIQGGSAISIHTHLENMGQALLLPPSVFGWNLEEGWLSSSMLLARYRFAIDVIASRIAGGTAQFRPERFIKLSLTDPAAIVDQAIAALDRGGQYTAAEKQVFADYLGPGPVNLADREYRNTKLRGLFGLVLQSPAYQLH